jgi:hypothetical protein
MTTAAPLTPRAAPDTPPGPELRPDPAWAQWAVWLAAVGGGVAAMAVHAEAGILTRYVAGLLYGGLGGMAAWLATRVVLRARRVR